jgi:hypothetical protein
MIDAEKLFEIMKLEDELIVAVNLPGQGPDTKEQSTN